MIGDRMRQARLAAGFTLAEVAERLEKVGQSITTAGLSKYEHNKSVPSAAFLLKLARALEVKSSYFLHEPEVRVEWLAFRKHSTLPARQQARVQATANTIAEGQFWLQTTLYPNEKPAIPATRTVTTLVEAEAAAVDLRAVWKLGNDPIESVTQTTEDRGGIVIGWRNHTAGFDGLSGWLNDEVPVAVMDMSAPPDRRRFSLAHELGHMLLTPKSPDSKFEEKMAHRFAAAFLVPAEVARRELGTRRRHLDFDEIGLLKERHGLSMQAWARRALDVGIVDEAYYRNWCIEFSRRGWRKEEPYTFDGQEEPTRLKQMTLHALAEGMITEERALQLCPSCLTPQHTNKPAEHRYTAVELMKLPREERNRILAEAAAEAAEEYRSNSELTEFEAFGEDDLYDEYPE
ncbi:MAG TPA: XRE family transcriptional regulator [Ktedonobacterales bacterium]|jgi:Zn-dependent peptidase ImmA (M78 family)